MKKILLLSTLIVGVLLIKSSSNGVTTAQNLDRTGSPVGTGSCNSCHSGGNYNPTLQLKLLNSDSQAVTEYQPDSTYTLEVLFGGNTAPRYGMQAVALLNGSNNNAGTLSAANNKSKIVTLNNRRYADHNGFISDNSFELTWLAPSEGSGMVNFYASGIAANGSGSSGDSPVTALALLVGEADGEENPVDPEIPENPNSLFIIAHKNINFFPNPTHDFIAINQDFTAPILIEVYNLNGSKVLSDNHNGYFPSINLAELKNGCYFVTVKINNQIILNQKIIKI
jgi:hypothetical protein